MPRNWFDNGKDGVHITSQRHPGLILIASWLVRHVDWFDGGKDGVNVQWHPGLILIASQLIQCWFDVLIGSTLAKLASTYNSVTTWSNSTCQSIGLTCRLVRLWQSWHPHKPQQRPGLILIASRLVWCVDWVDSGIVGVHNKFSDVLVLSKLPADCFGVGSICRLVRQWQSWRPSKIQWRPGLTLLAKKLIWHWQRRRPHENSTMPWSNSNCQLTGLTCRLIWRWQSGVHVQWRPGLVSSCQSIDSMLVWCVNRVDSGKFVVHVKFSDSRSISTCHSSGATC